MNLKRGQLSLFIFLTILIVFIILIFSSYNFFTTPKTPEFESNVKEEISNCFKENFHLEINAFAKLYNLNHGEVSYFYENDTVNVPSIDFFEKEFQNFSYQIMLECINSLNDSDLIKNIDYNFNSINVNIEKEIILISLDLILNINDSKIIYLIDFNKEDFIYDSDFYSMHEFALFFTEHLKENQEWIPVKESLDFCNLREIEFYYEEDLDYEEVVVYLVSKSESAPESFVFYNKLNYNPPIEGEIFL